MIGFVLFHREIMDWEWYQSPTVSRLYFHLILKVNFTTKKWQGIIIERGQLVTSINTLSAELKLSNQQIRTALDKLIDGNYIIKLTTNNYTLITLVNYDKHQSQSETVNKRNNKRITNEQQMGNKPSTTTKQGKKVNNINKDRKEDFQKKVFENTNYSNKILNSFFNHWSELDGDLKKMRWEGENYFEISKRLDKWVENEKKWNTNSAQKEVNKISNNR